MLSKSQANGIADELVQQAEASRLEALNAAARPVSPHYRCLELNALQPWQREDVVRQATTAVARGTLFVTFVVVWIAALGLFWFYGPAQLHQSPLLVLPIIACWVIPMLVYKLFVRREVRKIAAQLLPSWASAEHASHISGQNGT